ncbi:hypothetical protein [Leptodesmis sichuanensis]|uniref:hypothetical protein n=1 Tax=Leptodesmis sichuanensis TaxID=2906798 RepID=UPI001F482F19|nr:hypothetical protein [Leptodesmis sichuanensis]UIE39045.1 hypothetical protein KIK02_05465 [Leptodesmis sichuanensis A121]
MKTLLSLSLVATFLVGCTAQTVTSPTPSEPVTPPAASPSPTGNIQVEEFTLDEVGARGCGMYLWKADRKSKDRFVFFKGLNPDSMTMRINGQIVKFTRTAGTGDEFYGQQTSQTFRSEDGSTSVIVEVVRGAKQDVEVMAIDQGTIRVSKNGQEVTTPVVGNAGC